MLSLLNLCQNVKESAKGNVASLTVGGRDSHLLCFIWTFHFNQHKQQIVERRAGTAQKPLRNAVRLLFMGRRHRWADHH